MDCRVVCGPKLDYEDRRGPADALRDHHIPYHIERCAPPRWRLRVVSLPTERGARHPVPPSGVRPGAAHAAEGVRFSTSSPQLRAVPPPTSYSPTAGSPSPPPHPPGQAGGRKVVSPCTTCRTATRHCSATWTQSASRRVRTMGLPPARGVEAEAVEYPRNLTNVLVDRPSGGFVTFINPIPVKGSALFSRIALEMGSRRPDIPFLVFEGRGGTDGLARLPIHLSGLTTVRGLHSTPRPSEFYALSRMVLMPSLWEETFGRVAAEALANGIPVLASRRGALPETLGDAGFLSTSRTIHEAMTDVPNSEEVAMWVEVIERLWMTQRATKGTGRRH